MAHMQLSVHQVLRPGALKQLCKGGDCRHVVASLVEGDCLSVQLGQRPGDELRIVLAGLPYGPGNITTRLHMVIMCFSNILNALSSAGAFPRSWRQDDP